MQPTLRADAIVIATGLYRSIEPEQVVVIYHDGLEKVKRVQRVRHGRVFVIGDNESSSLDSRTFGWLPLEAVVAKVIWPRT